VNPYYQDSAVTIWNADCREIVPTLGRFDLLLTDPPYGISRDTAPHRDGVPASDTEKRKRSRKAYEGDSWDSERPSIDTFDAVLSCSETAVIWGGNYFADILPRSTRWLVWDKAQRLNQSDGELAWTTLNGMALRIFTLNRAAIGVDGAVHPTQKPLELMRWCIGLAGDVQTILDPFAGSGTTGRAAKDLGRKCVLIEREERYCEIAAKRMLQECFIFNELPTPPPKPQQMEMFGDMTE
jgi:DNA modification methylase